MKKREIDYSDVAETDVVEEDLINLYVDCNMLQVTMHLTIPQPTLRNPRYL